ncbi:hypothetical protein LUZ60_012453 [Juncus effusus]|nr:hypothetical protein LUZ60_012453 [Juncus effusus]
MSKPDSNSSSVSVSSARPEPVTDRNYMRGLLHRHYNRSTICYIDGDEGILRYRGYPIEELAENSSFVEVAYLISLNIWKFAVTKPIGGLGICDLSALCCTSRSFGYNTCDAHEAHPMGVLVSATSALLVFHPDANPALRGQDLYKSKQVRDKQILRILGKKALTIAAAAYLRLAGRPPVLPSSNLSYSENFLYMLDSLGNRAYKPNPRLARVLDILFILHAEHENNCSTAAARHLASSGVDVYCTGWSSGSSAVLKMLNEMGKVENIPGFIIGVKNRRRKMSGFRHRVYKNYYPRAKVIRSFLHCWTQSFN